MSVQVSMFASSIRHQLYPAFFNSLSSTTVDYEVVFAGPNPPPQSYPKLKYITTSNIKPAQCYEIARRHCQGEVVIWVADDCEFPQDIVGIAYRHWQAQGQRQLVLSIQTRENYDSVGKFCDMGMHRFFYGDLNTPIMAPIGLMSREFLNELGGIDKRYVCGQYENDIVMRVYEKGGSVQAFGDHTHFIDIDHMGKALLLHENFKERSFAQGYDSDRKVLEGSWVVEPGVISKTRLDALEPFQDDQILAKSQSHNIPRIWTD